MVRIFTTLVLLVSATFVFGQVTITSSQNPAFKSGFANAFDIVGKVVLTNTSSEAKTFTWTRDEAGFEEGWESGVCDINTCYGRSRDSASFELEAGATGTLDVHLYPEGYCGVGFCEITVSDDADATNFIVVKFDFESVQAQDVPCATPTSVRDFKLDYVKVYPNPANDFFTLTDVPSDLEVVTIYNILGNQVKTFKAAQNANYDISELTKGLYLVNLTNQRGENLNTIKLRKN